MAEERLAYLLQKWREESAAAFFYHLGHTDAGVLVMEIERLRAALEDIRDGRIIKDMSPSDFADMVLDDAS